jgi:hypothetical protein
MAHKLSPYTASVAALGAAIASAVYGATLVERQRGNLDKERQLRERKALWERELRELEDNKERELRELGDRMVRTDLQLTVTKSMMNHHVHGDSYKKLREDLSKAQHHPVNTADPKT